MKSPNSAQSPSSPIATIQVDLDSLWAVKQVYGIPVQEQDIEDDPLFETGLTRILEMLDERETKATLFVIGKDCESEKKVRLLKQAADAGHKLANHSYHHPIGMGNLPPEEILAEIEKTNAAIEQISGSTPIGFRSPGYDISPAIIDALIRAGMRYDASILPSPFTAVMRVVAGLIARGGSAAGKGHYGRGPLWKAPTSPYVPDPQYPWKEAGNDSNAPQQLMEFPVSVSPGLRMPIHAGIAIQFGLQWLRRSLRKLASRDHAQVHYVFHLTDLTGGEELDGLPRGFLAGRVLGRSSSSKTAFARETLDCLQSLFTILTVEELISRNQFS
ncbi:MAG: polysaccharide deacetylase family protein [Candidatus Sumerlaeia bacterium]